MAALERARATLKRYRASVLKAAVEGRLMPTEAELARREGRDYEPASILLQRILAGRRRRWEEAELASLKAKGKTPNGHSWAAKYKEPITPDTSGLPELREGWCWSTLDQLLVSLEGGTPATATDVPSERKVLRSSAVRQGRVDLQDVRFLAVDAPHKDDSHIAEGDLLFSRLSGSLDYVGNCAIVPELGERHIEFPDRIFRGRCVTLVSSRYIQLCFGERRLRRPLEKAAKSTAGHQRISLSDLRRFHIPLPPLHEQARIATDVERHLSIVTATLSIVEGAGLRCQRLRQAILKWAFEGKLVDQDPSDEPASALLDRLRAEREARKAAQSKSGKVGRRKRIA